LRESGDEAVNDCRCWKSFPITSTNRLVSDKNSKEVYMSVSQVKSDRFPTAAGILLGLGLGGFFDGILLHQVLQWHHMVTSAGYPTNTLENLEFNVLLDGLFHLATYAFSLTGLMLLWRATRRPHAPWSNKLLCGTILLGFGIFNVVEGIIDHHLLSLHHVNETVPPNQWIYWDLGFLVWGALMIIGGWRLQHTGQQETLTAHSSKHPAISGS
jgi:uncharacterized membrane protein